MLIRQFIIPNPVDALGEGITLTIAKVPVLLSPDFLNWLAEPMVFAVTFGVVGLYYISSSAPAWGSVLYMLFYCIHIAGLHLLMSIYPMIWLMALIIAAYATLHIIALIVKNRVLYCN